MSKLDPRERDLVKCEDMRIYASGPESFLARAPWLISKTMNWCKPQLSDASK
jgi:hypothetical protein